MPCHNKGKILYLKFQAVPALSVTMCCFVMGEDKYSNLHRARVCRVVASVADNSERPIAFTQRSRACWLQSFFLRLSCIHLRRCS